jgi:plastocyanin
MPAATIRSQALRVAIALALVGWLASLLTLVAPPPARAAEHAVEIGDGFFSPATLTISVGDTVTWRNADDSPHTATSDDGTFDSGNLDEGVGFSFTFTEPGTYTYICIYHEEMQGTIVVEAADAAPAPQSGNAAGGTDASSGGGEDSAAQPTSHEPGTHEAGQPDTALDLPASVGWIAPLLIGLGLVALAFGVVPPAPETVRVDRSGTGWRR